MNEKCAKKLLYQIVFAIFFIIQVFADLKLTFVFLYKTMLGSQCSQASEGGDELDVPEDTFLGLGADNDDDLMSQVATGLFLSLSAW